MIATKTNTKIEELVKGDTFWMSTDYGKRLVKVIGNFPEDRIIRLGVYGFFRIFIHNESNYNYNSYFLRDYKYLNQ